MLDLQCFKELMETFSRATGLYVEMVNKEGESCDLFDTAERCEFCQYIRSQPNGLRKCRNSYKQATLEAAKWDEPYFFRCRAGLVIWVVPISVNGVLVWSIICSQVLLWKPDCFFYQELRTLNPEVADFTEMERKVARLGIVAPERFQAAADILHIIVNQLVKQDLRIFEKIGVLKIQQRIYKELENRKKQHFPVVKGGNDYGVYLQEERSFLRYIRLGDKLRVEKNLRRLLTDLFIKTVGDRALVKIRIVELATVVSRAAVEGGVEPEKAMVMLQQFNQKVDDCYRMEEFFFHVQKLVNSFLEQSLSLVNKKHCGLVNEAKNFILENYSRTIKVGDVAAHLFISPSYLSRLFRQELNCTVNDYITRVRVEEAVELMKKPELSVAQVAQSLGFQSQSYFAKIFCKYIGVAPLIYRNSLF